mmetsp:Transcript_24510/g.47620  ORF Transcript_24510/g.47620 Transcript_24510/m.47620 type:complete len:84 (+) Transcript_24510:2-253(+)
MLLAMLACTTQKNVILNNAFPSDFPETAKKLVERTTNETSPRERGLFSDIKKSKFFGNAAFGDEMNVSAISFQLLVDDAKGTR